MPVSRSEGTDLQPMRATQSLDLDRLWTGAESGTPPLSDATTCDVLEKVVMTGPRLAPIGTPGRIRSDADSLASPKSAGVPFSAPIHR
jgi:hypothetical protein